ncbi:type VI secretion protein VgrG [Candidatus Tenderia electrophaga]|jgi:Rhs element Vgr protein|uniref:Type VI secretion protein VgrG n=1 Tax=Candidatus Tenderia electrophaga TaxID=1748243 RepID=A0A0S2TFK2_9GAMM|nr:type VI secretion protein VgrG [Candidatus Tenderia electrophaga]
MAESPLSNSDGVIKLTISSNGSEIDEAIQLVSVSVTKTINKIPYAKIVLLDGDMPQQDFPVSNGDEFKPGSEVEIKAGYGDSEESIFKGVVVKHGIKISGDNYSRLVIECRDPAVAMCVGRKNANYIDAKDSDVIATLIANYSGLSSDVEATTTQYKELVQYYCSDWDFMLSRAEANGLLVCCEDGKLTVKAPQTDAAAQLKVSYGQDLMEFHADLDARSQLSQVSGFSWDPKDQAIVQEQVKPQSLNAQGDLTAADLAKVLNLSDFRLQTAAPLEKSALKDWATGQQIKAGLARIRGRMKFQGSAKAKLGELIELEGVGNRFNGNVFVSSVNHDIANGNWVTAVEFGMAPDWFAEQRDLVAPPAAGLLPGVEGLQIGVVKKLDADPDGQHKVQVSLPLLQAESEGVWARLANFYASNSFGAFFIPEIGDEVVLGYLNNDPSNPVILGSLYSSKLPPPYDLSADNFTKALVTKSELKVEFDDDKKVVTILTPAGNTIVISDDEKSILLQDQNSNKVELSESGIVLDSPKDISITAKGKISLDATGEIGVSSKADVSVKGMNVNNTADVGFTAKGSASAEISASGQTTVKGAMVMIN